MESTAKKVLIVEDEAIVAADIEESVSGLGYTVCGISDTAEKAFAEIEKSAPDLILMDIRLKGELDGIEATAQLQKRCDTPVIYLTAHADPETLERAKITRPYGYVLKPFNDVELRVAMELALYRHALDKRSDGGPESLAREAEDVPSTEGSSGADDGNVAVELLSKLDLFSSLPLGALRRFSKACHVRSCKAGELLSYEGDDGDSGFFVLSGRIAMFKTSMNGRELIVDVLLPGDIFGLMLAIDHEPQASSTRAQISSEVLYVPKSAFLLLVEENPKLYRSFIEVISKRLRRSYGVSRALAHDRVEVRIASALLALTPEGASSDSDREIYITRQELADLTGSTVETAIRVTKSMEREGLLNLSTAGKIQIEDQSALAEIADQLA